MKNEKISDLTFMAMYLALFMVLDWLTNILQILKMPEGGSLGLAVVPLLVCSYHLGWKKGTAVALLSVLLQFMTGKVYIIQNSDGYAMWQIMIQFLMEYPVAFGIYGIASLFPNHGGFYTGVMWTNLIRLAIHTVAGIWFWGSPFWASFTYNAWYMLPTMLLCLVVVPLLIDRLSTLPFFKPVTK